MKRKVIKQGHNTLTVTLPKKWVDRIGLSNGDEVDVEERDDNLLLGVGLKPARKKISISLKSSHSKYIKAVVRNLYVHGFDYIKISYKDDIDYVTVSKIVDRLDGIEIIQEYPNGCVIESIADIKPEQFTKFYDKIYQVIIYMQQIVSDALVNGATKDNLKIVKSLSCKTSRFACICRRNLTKNKMMNEDSAIVIFSTINMIHMIARNYYSMYSFLTDTQVSKCTKEYFGYAVEHFEELYKLHAKKKVDAIKISERREKLITKVLPECFASCNKGEAMILHYLAENIRLVGTVAPKVGLMNEFLD